MYDQIQFLGPNGNEVPIAALEALFFSPDDFIFLVCTIMMGNSEPIPTIFLKLG